MRSMLVGRQRSRPPTQMGGGLAVLAEP